MFSARHRAEARPTRGRRPSKLTRLVVASTTITATVVTVGVATGASDTGSSTPVTAGASLGSVDLEALDASREQRASRTAKRVALKPRPTDHKFATAPLNVWTQPREKGKRVGLVKWGTKLPVTGQVVGHWAEILVKGKKVRWVNADFLANKKPKPKPKPEPEQPATTSSSDDSSSTSTGTSTSGISTAPCPDGSSIESGLTSSAVRLYRAVCAAFPQPTTYGGLDPHGEHIDGRAIDIMISGETGWAIAEWLRANAGTLGIRDIIYSQKIWTPDRAGEGWRYMSDRGSTTANHYDHVHVAVY